MLKKEIGMGKIRPLSETLIGKIAAGEVVERPAAAIKELIENSLDAGATAVTVEIQEGGLASIRVADNGSGIDESDIRMAFERHATSKIIREQDLNAISTLGFRGEALASIAAVTRVSLITNEKLKNFVKCEFKDDKLVLTCTTSIGQAYDECHVEPLEGGDLTIGFNSRYLLDSLRACRDEEVRIEFNTPNSPCIIKPTQGDQYLYLILPVRLKA